MLANVGDFTKQPDTALLVAISPDEKVVGAVVYFNDMKYYDLELLLMRKEMRQDIAGCEIYLQKSRYRQTLGPRMYQLSNK